MTMTDPIADMLTRIRNGVLVKKQTVDVPASKVKASIADVLKRQGYIVDYEVVLDGIRGTIRVKLKYDEEGTPAITNIRRESKPGRRAYRSVGEVPKVLGGLGVAVMSTSKGVLSDGEARTQRVGGEYLCSVY
jgi:small subunit ribosomal protein S8